MTLQVLRQPLWPFLKDAFALIAPFWSSQHKVLAWLLLTLSIFVNFGLVAISAKLTFVYADMFDALEQKQIDVFYRAGLIYITAILLITGISTLNVLADKYLSMLWRKWLTYLFAESYMHNKLYNQVELIDYGADNPDQRISVDINTMCDETISLGISFLRNLVNVFTFGGVLWVISGPLNITLFGYQFHIPGYMFWIAIAYAAFVTWLTHIVANPLTWLQNRRQKVEADFRFGLTRIRENAESIALLFGGKREGTRLSSLFDLVRSNWCELVKYRVRLTGVLGLATRFNFLFPILVSLPGYIAGNMTIGAVMQARTAFTQVAVSLEWFANSYQMLANWKASVDRVLELQSTFSKADSDRNSHNIRFKANDAGNVMADGLSIYLPNGQPLLERASFKLSPGQHVMITGTSGAGKSTLFRVLSGLWVWGKGEVHFPSNQNIMFMPQKPYLPIASLREALSYPQKAGTYSDDEIIACLNLCHLAKFAARLNEVENWSRVLSGGEQQRAGFVRAILARPDWLFLDEASSALDPRLEAALYTALADQLPSTTIISIAHRNTLLQFHDQILNLDAKNKSINFIPIPS